MKNPASVPAPLRRLTREMSGEVTSREVADFAAAESPLTLRVEGRAVAVIMRTPGYERELAAGFLLTEGVIRSRRDVFEISVCPSVNQGGDSVDVVLTDAASFDAQRLTRHVFTSSSCGVCGKTDLLSTLSAGQNPQHPGDGPVIPAEFLFQLPDQLRGAQATFASTGGLHGCAWFPVSSGSRSSGSKAVPALSPTVRSQSASEAGTTIEADRGSQANAGQGRVGLTAVPAVLENASAPALVFEDVGRHNALDKLLGSALLTDQLPLDRGVLLLSGRVSFELVQKAATARIPVIAAIGAPSSLAIEYAAAAGITLCGFLKNGRVNLYTHPARIAVDGPPSVGQQ